VLAVDGLKAAIQNYEERHGLVEEQVPTDLHTIERRLKHVMNPMVGLDVLRTKLVKEYSFEDGVVRIVLDLAPDHQFANNLREDIVEKIEPIWDVSQVIVEFAS
jgi:metal-sulfur cluster biosynthetic enzyme